MKRLGLFLLAVFMMAGVTGCGGGDDDFSPTAANMAGVYTPTKVTYVEGGVMVTFVPPDISGSLNLTAAGTYTIDLTIKGERITGSGTYAISGDTFIVDGGDGSGTITDDGRMLSLTIVEGGQTLTIDFTRT